MASISELLAALPLHFDGVAPTAAAAKQADSVATSFCQLVVAAGGSVSLDAAHLDR